MSASFTQIIRRKRDGGELDSADIARFVDGLADGSLPAEQVSALAMAIFLRSMTFAEAGRLTAAMAASGTTLEWPDEHVIDKHSTGGVGDKVSFMLAPIAAACGCLVPMISGRGLGHTGGTLDKIGVIPGYNVTPSLERFQSVVRKVGCAIIGQTTDLAPADRRLYAVRDVTGTVESIPLITASILSKKIAAGNQALVMDVKAGSGAFMATLEDARALAKSLLGTARAAGLPTVALITDMDEPLGTTVGNALEIGEALAYLHGDARDARLDAVTRALAVEMLLLAGVETDVQAAQASVAKALDSGAAAEHFQHMVSALGGPADFVERYASYLPEASYQQAILPATEGFLSAIDTRAIGEAVIALGGGRRRLDDELDLSVGFDEVAPVGTEVGPERPLAIVHAPHADAAEAAMEAYLHACTVTTVSPPAKAAVIERLVQESE